MSAFPRGIASSGVQGSPGGFDMNRLVDQFLGARGGGGDGGMLGLDRESTNPLLRLLANSKIAVATPKFAFQSGGSEENSKVEALLDELIASRQGVRNGASPTAMNTGIQVLGGGPSTDTDIPIRRPMRITSDDDPLPGFPGFPRFGLEGFQGVNFR